MELRRFLKNLRRGKNLAAEAVKELLIEFKVDSLESSPLLAPQAAVWEDAEEAKVEGRQQRRISIRISNEDEQIIDDVAISPEVPA